MTPRVTRTGTARFLTYVLLAYAACRLVSGVLLAIVAMRQVPTGWTGPDVSYLTFTTQWDGQWYLHIAEQGYPRRLPTNETGLVQQNAWAFYPLFPFVSRALMDLTHLDFYVVGSTVSLLLGFVAAGAIALLLRDRIGDRFTLAAVVLWASMPAAVVLQVGYTEAMAMALLALFLLALSRERWLWAMSLALLLGLTRPIAVPIAAVTVVALWCRWRARTERPLVPTEIAAGVAALAGCGVSGLLWPVIAGAVTGQANAYTATMSTWRGSREIVPFKPWLDMSRYYFGSTWGPGVAHRAVRRHRRHGARALGEPARTAAADVVAGVPALPAGGARPVHVDLPLPHPAVPARGGADRRGGASAVARLAALGVGAVRRAARRLRRGPVVLDRRPLAVRPADRLPAVTT